MVIIMSQFQMLILLLTSGAYIPKSIGDYFVGMEYALISLNVDYKKQWPISIFVNWIDYRQSNSMLQFIGLKSGSTAINLLLIFGVLLLIVIFHGFFLLVWLLLKWIKRWESLTKFNNIILKNFSINVYIRLMIQSHILLLLWSISEVKNAKVNTENKAVSFAISFLMLSFWIGVLVLMWIFYAKNHKKHQIGYKFSELFNGFKQKSFARAMNVISELRKLLFVALLIIYDADSITVKISIFCFIQLIYLFYILLVRPFNKTSDNLICLVNESTFTFCSWMLIYFNTSARWTGFVEKLYMLTIIVTTNGCITII